MNEQTGPTITRPMNDLEIDRIIPDKGIDVRTKLKGGANGSFKSSEDWGIVVQNGIIISLTTTSTSTSSTSTSTSSTSTSTSSSTSTSTTL